MGILLAWGPFRFETGSLTYNELRHKKGKRRRRHEIIGRAPAGQYLGPDEETLKLRGTLYPVYDGAGVAQQLADMQDAAEADQSYILLAGTGEIFGLFDLVSCERVETEHLPDGSAQKIVFDAEFVADVDPAGSVWSSWP